MQTTRQQLVAAFIRKQVTAQMEAGLDFPAAYDSVMGAGAYKKLAGEVYHALRGE